MRICWPILCLALAVSACGHQQPSGQAVAENASPAAQAPTPAVVPAGWNSVTGDGFSMAFPATPTKTSKTLNNPAGGTMTVTIYLAHDGQTVYMVQDTDMGAGAPPPSAADVTLNGYESGFGGSMGAKVASSSNTTFQGVPAHRASLTGKIDTDMIDLITGARLYGLTVSRPSGTPLDDQKAKAFFDSFRLTNPKG